MMDSEKKILFTTWSYKYFIESLWTKEVCGWVESLIGLEIMVVPEVLEPEEVRTTICKGTVKEGCKIYISPLPSMK